MKGAGYMFFLYSIDYKEEGRGCDLCGEIIGS